MKIVVTLSEALHRGNDWGAFCEEFGWSDYAVAEGGGHIEQELTEAQAIKYGLIPSEATE